MCSKVVGSVILILAFTFSNAQGQNINEIAAKVDSIRKSTKIINFGVSVGYRLILESRSKLLRNATISPVDSTLQVDNRDRSDLVISGVVMAYPFKNKKWTKFPGTFLKKLGFLANINVAEFTTESVTVNNKSIEGGIGLSYCLHPNFSLSMTVERLFSRALRSNLETGKKYVVGGETLTSIDINDDRFFADDNLTGFAVMFVYIF